ncbi:MAG: hypothetical protein IH616_18115 [Gemmatimonadales bacterium]|nr:hypothetical protein [Gemmatimonadales bacterium]
MVSVGNLHSGISPEALLYPVDGNVRELLPNVRGSRLYRGQDGGVYQTISTVWDTYTAEYVEARGLASLAGMGYGWSSAFLPYDPTGTDAELHLFGIAADGSVHRLAYSFPEYNHEGESTRVTLPAFRRRSVIDLPARARQITSDGRLAYVLLADGSVYILNPEILVSEAGYYPEEGVDEGFTQRSYMGRFRPAALTGTGPLRVQGASNICRIDGIYLVTCGGQLFKIDRSYYWLLVSYPFNAIRAPGTEYMVVPDTRFDARGWRALKMPLTADVVWEDAYFRLLVTVDGSYVMQQDTNDIRLGAGSHEMGGSEITQQVVESWLVD